MSDPTQISHDDTTPLSGRTSPQHAVRVQHHQPDINNLFEQVLLRTQALLEAEQPAYLFANPIITVTSDQPAPEFFRVVRKRQAAWCKQSRTLFGRKAMRQAKHWVMPTAPMSKYQRFLTRALCFTGILLVYGKVTAPHEWHDIERSFRSTIPTGPSSQTAFDVSRN